MCCGVCPSDDVEMPLHCENRSYLRIVLYVEKSVVEGLGSGVFWAWTSAVVCLTRDRVNS